MASNDPLDPTAYYDAFVEQGMAPQQQPQAYLPPLDPATLPRFSLGDQRGWLMPGIRAGMQDVGGLLAGAVGAVGGAVGADSVRDWGIDQMRQFEQRSQEVGRPDLDVMPWSDQWAQNGNTLADVPAWLGYQAAKQVPQMGLAMAGGGMLGRLGAVQRMAAPFAETAATLPRYMGGGALRAGMAAEERDAAMAAGTQLANQYVGTTMAGLPVAAGSMYQSEVDRADAMGEAPRQGAAIASLGLAPFYSAVDAVAPSSEVGMLRRGLEGNLGRRVATAALSEGVQESIQEGVQTGMEMAFRPDLSPVEKAQNMVDAALTGFAVGGVFGAPGGIRRLAKTDPATTTTDDLASATTTAVPPGAPSATAPAASTTPPPPGPPPGASTSAATPPGPPPAGVPPVGASTSAATPPAPLTDDERAEVDKAMGIIAKVVNTGERPTNGADINDFYGFLQRIGTLKGVGGKDNRRKVANFYGLIDRDGAVVPLDQALATAQARLDEFNRRNAAGGYAGDDSAAALGASLTGRRDILQAMLAGGDLPSITAPSINGVPLEPKPEGRGRMNRRRRKALEDAPSSLDGAETEAPDPFRSTWSVDESALGDLDETPPGASTPPAASTVETPPPGASTPPAASTALKEGDAAVLRDHPELMRELSAVGIDEVRRRGIKELNGFEFSDGSRLHANPLGADTDDDYYIEHPDGTTTWIDELGKVHAAASALTASTPPAGTATAPTGAASTVETPPPGASTPPEGGKGKTTSPSRPAPGVGSQKIPSKPYALTPEYVISTKNVQTINKMVESPEKLPDESTLTWRDGKRGPIVLTRPDGSTEEFADAKELKQAMAERFEAQKKAETQAKTETKTETPPAAATETKTETTPAAAEDEGKAHWYDDNIMQDGEGKRAIAIYDQHVFWQPNGELDDASKLKISLGGREYDRRRGSVSVDEARAAGVPAPVVDAIEAYLRGNIDHDTLGNRVGDFFDGITPKVEIGESEQKSEEPPKAEKAVEGEKELKQDKARASKKAGPKQNKGEAKRAAEEQARADRRALETELRAKRATLDATGAVRIDDNYFERDEKTGRITAYRIENGKKIRQGKDTFGNLSEAYGKLGLAMPMTAEQRARAQLANAETAAAAARWRSATSPGRSDEASDLANENMPEVVETEGEPEPEPEPEPKRKGRGKSKGTSFKSKTGDADIEAVRSLRDQEGELDEDQQAVIKKAGNALTEAVALLLSNVPMSTRNMALSSDSGLKELDFDVLAEAMAKAGREPTGVLAEPNDPIFDQLVAKAIEKGVYKRIITLALRDQTPAQIRENIGNKLTLADVEELFEHAQKYKPRYGQRLGLRLGPADQPITAVRGIDMPVRAITSVGKLLDAMLKTSGGDKRLRAMSGLLRKFADKTKVVIVPRADLKAATGFDGFYDTDEKAIYLPYDPSMTNDETIHTFLHEAVHGALHDKLSSSSAARTQIMLLARKLAGQAGVNKDAYAFNDSHEFLSEAMSNSELQEQLEKLTLSAREAYQMGVSDAPNGFAAFVNMVKEWLGWRAPINGLEAIMRIQTQVAYDVNIAPKGVMAYINKELQGVGIGNLEKLLESTSDREIEKGKQALMNGSRQLISGVDSSLRGVVLGVDRLMDTVSRETLARRTAADSSLRIAIRKMELYWSNFGHILQKFGKLFKDALEIGNPLEAYGKHMTQRQALTARMAQLWRNVNDQWTAALKRSPNIAKELAENLNKVMQISTEFGIDPEKPFAAQAHLVTASNSAELRRLWQEAKDALDFVKGKPHGSDVFKKLRGVNNSLMYAYQAIQIYNMVRSDPFFHDAAGARPSLAMTRVDPVEQFLKDKDLHEDPIKSEEYWKKAIDDRLDETKAYLDFMGAQSRAGLLTKKEQTTFDRASKPLNKLEKDIRAAMESIKRAPYFHLGRHGDYIVRFDIRRDPTNDKKVDPAALSELVDALKDEFPDVHISKATEQYHVMARFESADDRNKFHDAIKELEGRGLVTAGETKTGELSDIGSMAAMQPDWLARYIENIKSDTGLTDTQRDAMISTARITWLDMLPDTAVVRVLAERKNVPGSHSNMLRNFAFRAEVGVNALANLSIAAKISEAFTEMKNQYRAASEDTSRRAEAVMMHQVIEELQKRDADRPSTTGTDWIDRLRAWNHSFFLGASPAYVAVNMTQLGVMLWPELAKKHGFVKAAKAITTVTPLAFKLIKATFDEGKKLGWSRSLDAIITHDALVSALPESDPDPATAELRTFLERMINSGNIDLGSPMRELGRKSTGTQDKWDDHALRIASVMGYYSETLSRLIAVMAAHKLEKAAGTSGPQIERYAGGVLNDAMLNYSNWYTSRATGKAGVLGRFTPVPASFQQYTMQVIQKLYREIYDAFSGQQIGEDAGKVAQRKKEARTFLKGHATVIAMLAGTLGLPFSSVAFRLVDGLRDAFGDDDDEPHDTKVDYRNWLATVFGEDVAEVIARGLPHAFAFDVSSRVGEQDIAPLSRFIADRRKMEDAVKDLAMRSWGSPVSMTLNVAVGASEFAKGNYMQGLQMLMPKAISDGLKASDMVMHGYRDEQGRKLPMRADPADIAYQALGLKPADKAEYSEENLARVTRKTQMQERASQLRSEVVDAIENGGDVQGKTRKAASFGAKNPAFAPLPSLASTLGRRRKQEAVARALAAPIGYNVQDAGERQSMRFGNYGPDR